MSRPLITSGYFIHDNSYILYSGGPTKGVEIDDDCRVALLQTGDLIKGNNEYVMVTGIERYIYSGYINKLYVTGNQRALTYPTGYFSFVMIDDAYISSGGDRVVRNSGDMQVKTLEVTAVESLPDSGGIYYPGMNLSGFNWPDSLAFASQKTRYSAGYVVPIISIDTVSTPGYIRASKIYISGGKPFVLDGVLVSGE